MVENVKRFKHSNERNNIYIYIVIKRFVFRLGGGEELN